MILSSWSAPLARIGLACAEELEPQALLQRIGPDLCSLAAADFALLECLDRPGRRLLRMLFDGSEQRVDLMTEPLSGVATARNGWACPLPFSVGDSQGRTDWDLPEWQRQRGLEAMVYAPLLLDGQSDGGLGALWHAPPPDLSTLLAPFGALAMMVTTSLRRTQQRRSREEDHDQAEHLFAEGPDGHALIRDGRILRANSALAELLGNPDELSLLGLQLSSLLSDGACDQFIKAEGRGEYFLRNARGAAQLFELTSSQVQVSGRPALLCSFRNIQQRKRREADEVFADRMRSLGTLSAGVAHELNNPLAFVTSNLEYALEAVADPTKLGELKPVLTESMEGLKRMRIILRDLRSFARPDEGTKGPVDLRKVVESSVHMGWHEIRQRARFCGNYQPVPLVLASEPRLAQVCLNLLVNAAHAIPPGAPDRHRIEVSLDTTAEGEVALAVRDTGTGISPEVMPHIFEPFFTTKKVGQGTGLGLSICHALINQMQGRIEVESEVGKGTLFRVLLPAAEEGRLALG